MKGLDLRPLDIAPVSIRAPFDVRRPRIWDLAANRADYLAALTEPFGSLTLGAYDERMIAWLAGWDLPTVGTVVSLLHRVRAATPLPRGGER